MQLILIFTLFISTYSVAASSQEDGSIWEGWNTADLASFLRRVVPCVDAISSALQYNYNNKHEQHIKKALTHLHQQNAKAVESCAHALYDALFLQEQAKEGATTPLSSYQQLPSFKKSELFKAGKLHPRLSRFIKQHGSNKRHLGNPQLDSLTDYFCGAYFTPNAAGEIIEVEIPLYIIKKNDCPLTQTHISTHDANTLTPGTLVWNQDALLTTETGAIFIYAKINLPPLLRLFSGTCSFAAYETKPSPTPRLKASSEGIKFSQKIEQNCAYLATLSTKINESAPQQQPDPSSIEQECADQKISSTKINESAPQPQPDSSIWAGWNTADLASFLRRVVPCVDAISSALQYNYNNKHEQHIKKALTHLHQQNAKAVESCAHALYDALFLQDKEGAATPLSGHQTLLSLKKSELFKAGKLHPRLSRFIKQHGSNKRHLGNPQLDSLTDYFCGAYFTPNAAGEIIEVEIPLYIIKKNDCPLTQTHISTHDANTLTPGTLVWNQDALLTTETGAIFIYAKINLPPLLRLFSGTCSFAAYETKPSPTPRLKASPEGIKFSQKIEQNCAYLATLSTKINESAPQQQPDPSSIEQECADQKISSTKINESAPQPQPDSSSIEQECADQKISSTKINESAPQPQPDSSSIEQECADQKISSTKINESAPQQQPDPSSSTATSDWDGWNIADLATFLQCHQPTAANLARASKKSYTSDHWNYIAYNLTAIHQRFSRAISSCAQAFYDALQDQSAPLPVLKHDELYKNGKLHPALSRLVKKHANRRYKIGNSRTRRPGDLFSVLYSNRNGWGLTSHICIPLYIYKSDSLQLTSPHISKYQEATLLPPRGPIASEANALLTAHDSALFIYAEIPLLPLLGPVRLVAYQTKQQPGSRLTNNADHQKFTQRIEQSIREIPQTSAASHSDLLPHPLAAQTRTLLSPHQLAANAIRATYTPGQV